MILNIVDTASILKQSETILVCFLVCSKYKGSDLTDAEVLVVGANKVIWRDVAALQLVGLEDQGNNQTVKAKGLGKDENQNDTNEELWLTSVGADTSVTNNANSNTGSKTGKATAKSGGERGEARV